LTGKAALEYVQNQEEDLREIAATLKSTPEQARDRVERLLRDLKQREREIEQLKARLLTSQSVDLLSGVRQVGDTRLLVREVTADSPKALREFADRIKDRLKSGIIVLGAKNEGKALLICVVTKDLVDRYRAGEIIKHLSALVGGKGGGRADMAQGGGSKPEELGRALESVYDLIKRAT
ncbi:MAG: alanine--tRNA ligase, partial [Deltaproteobacteria bacterium]|nr:alanine--tRNA ligase [Deltaproteobacteria bacterium]